MPLTSLAQTKTCQTNSALEACDKALRDADVVISKQGELMQLLVHQNDSLKSENDQLSRALIKLDEEVGDSWKDQVIWGGIALGVGVAVGVLVGK